MVAGLWMCGFSASPHSGSASEADFFGSDKKREKNNLSKEIHLTLERILSHSINSTNLILLRAVRF